jgi:hypothetical protein
MAHGARKAHTTVRAMQDTLDHKGIALLALRARTKPQSDLPIAHCVRSENTVGHLGQPVRTRVLLVWRAHSELNRAGLEPVIAQRV